MDAPSVLEVLEVPGLVALHLVKVQLIIRVRLGQIWQVPRAQLVHQWFRRRSRVKQRLLIEVTLRRVLQVLQRLLLLVALLIFHSRLKVRQDIVHVAETLFVIFATTGRSIVGLRLSVLVPALPLLKALAL